MKWLNAYFWYFWTPLPALIGMNNALWWTWDTFAFWGDPNFARMKPTMYDNWFSRLLLRNPFGVFAWYDVFSVQGYFNWMADSLLLFFLPWWELIKAFIRQGRNDWTYQTVERKNPIDKNRWFRPAQFADPYDFNYWSTKKDGRDCNGNVG